MEAEEVVEEDEEGAEEGEKEEARLPLAHSRQETRGNHTMMVLERNSSVVIDSVSKSLCLCMFASVS